MGSRKRLRANLKQQDGETSAACARRGALLGDVACEDLRSGSIIVVISAPRREPRLPGRVPRPPCLSVCLQPAKATGKGHGAGCTAPRPCSAAVYSSEAWTREDVHLSLLPVQMFIRPAVSMKGY